MIEPLKKLSTSKSKSFNLARLFAALSDPTRLRLLNLMQGREVCVCYFVEILQQGQPKISRHLAYLRKAEIVSARRDGKWIHYQIVRPGDAAAEAILEATLTALKADREMQQDLARFAHACSEPNCYVSLQAAPAPAEVWAEMPTA